MRRRREDVDPPLEVRRDGALWRWSVRLAGRDVGERALRGSVAHPTWQEAVHAATTAYPGVRVHVDRGGLLARIGRWGARRFLTAGLLVVVVLAVAARLRRGPAPPGRRRTRQSACD